MKLKNKTIEINKKKDTFKWIKDLHYHGGVYHDSEFGEMFAETVKYFAYADIPELENL